VSQGEQAGGRAAGAGRVPPAAYKASPPPAGKITNNPAKPPHCFKSRGMAGWEVVRLVPQHWTVQCQQRQIVRLAPGSVTKRGAPSARCVGNVTLRQRKSHKTEESSPVQQQYRLGFATLAH